MTVEMPHPPQDQVIGERVKAARERIGRPQRSLAISMQSVGIEWSQNHQTRTESGTRSLRLREAVALADCLGVSLDYFLGAEDTQAADQRARAELLSVREHIDQRLTYARVLETEKEEA